MSQDTLLKSARERMDKAIEHTTEMLRGAMYGAAVFFGVVVLIGAIALVGQLLPEESKQAPGPMPYSTLDQPSAPWIGLA